MADPGGRGIERIAWTVAAAIATAVLIQFRGGIGEAHVALAYLLIVLGASARGGRRLGLVLSFLCFLAFNFFFIAPYHTLAIHSPLDWLVLGAFLLTSAVATQLLHRAQNEAKIARRRATEIDRLATLGAQTLNAGRAEDAVIGIAHVIQEGLQVDGCEIHMDDQVTGRSRRVAAAGQLDADAKSFYIKLSARDKNVGVLRLSNRDTIVLDANQQRFADALSYYAALGIERMTLTAAAGRAEALQEADRLKDVLLASVSHDLRTPLTTIKALAHSIAESGDENAVVIEEEADRLNRYVADLLDLSRLSAEASLELELVAAEDVLGAALQQISGLDVNNRVRAFLDPAEPILIGRFHFVHTLRALVNLIDNALKYSPASAEVDVQVRRDGDRIAFVVADRGPGLAPEERDQVFQPFFRGSDAAGSGTGLGLPIALRAANLQGGTLQYLSREGGGSVFSLFVSAADPENLQRMSL